MYIGTKTVTSVYNSDNFVLFFFKLKINVRKDFIKYKHGKRGKLF